MSWATRAIEALGRGELVQIRPRGNSMKGKVNDGNLVTIEPWPAEKLEVDDIVLCRVNGNDYLHLIKAKDGGRFLIGNNKGGTNGWTRTVYGKVTKVEA